jgi:hypothetical protein
MLNIQVMKCAKKQFLVVLSVLFNYLENHKTYRKYVLGIKYVLFLSTPFFKTLFIPANSKLPSRSAQKHMWVYM